MFICISDGDDAVSLTKWSSMDLLPKNEDASGSGDSKKGTIYNDMISINKVYLFCIYFCLDDSIFCQHFLQRVTSERERVQKNLASRGSVEASLPGSPTMFNNYKTSGTSSSCSTTVLCLVLHAGSALDATVDLPAKKSDVTTFKGAFESVIRQHYPSMMGHVVIKLIPCPSICTDALGILSRYSFQLEYFNIKYHAN